MLDTIQKKLPPHWHVLVVENGDYWSPFRVRLERYRDKDTPGKLDRNLTRPNPVISVELSGSRRTVQAHLAKMVELDWLKDIPASLRIDIHAEKSRY